MEDFGDCRVTRIFPHCAEMKSGSGRQIRNALRSYGMNVGLSQCPVSDLRNVFRPVSETLKALAAMDDAVRRNRISGTQEKRAFVPVCEVRPVRHYNAVRRDPQGA